MIISLIGGTGNLGKGLAIRLALIGHKVIVGSRELEKAESKATEYNEILEKFGNGVKIKGLKNEEAAKIAEISIFTVPWKYAFSTAEKLKEFLVKKIVISPIVPMEKMEDTFIFSPPPEGSAAEKLAEILKDSKVVSAFHNIPAKRFAKFNKKLELDVVVCSDHDNAKKVVMNLIDQIDGLRALDGGPLLTSRMVESITPLLLTIAARNDMKELSVRFV